MHVAIMSYQMPYPSVQVHQSDDTRVHCATGHSFVASSRFSSVTFHCSHVFVFSELGRVCNYLDQPYENKWQRHSLIGRHTTVEQSKLGHAAKDIFLI